MAVEFPLANQKWREPNFNVPGTVIQDTILMVPDGLGAVGQDNNMPMYITATVPRLLY